MKYRRREIGGEEYFFLEHENRNIVYVPLRGAVFEVNGSAADMIKDDGRDLKQTGLFRDIWDQISSLPKFNRSVNHQLSTLFAPYSVGLCLTNKCNLACAYCHADSGPSGDAFLPWKIAKAALDFAFINAVESKKCLEVSFPGPGEPTQSWDMLCRAVDYVEGMARVHAPGHKISMSTNGVFPRQFAEFIAKHFSAVSLSFDGPSDIHNKHRPAASGTDTFKQVFATASFFYKVGFLFSIRATVSEFSVERMPEIWDFFEHHFPGIPVGFESMNPLGRGQFSTLRPPSISRFNRNFEILLAEADRHQGLLLNSGVGKLNQLRSSFCKSFSYPCMTVTADGHLTACTRDGSPEFFYYGSWNKDKESFDIDVEKIQLFRSISVHTFPECADCFAKYHCAGDCYDLRLAGIRRCSTNKRMVLIDLINKLDRDKSITSVSRSDPRYQKISKRVHHW